MHVNVYVCVCVSVWVLVVWTQLFCSTWCRSLLGCVNVRRPQCLLFAPHVPSDEPLTRKQVVTADGESRWLPSWGGKMNRAAWSLNGLAYWEGATEAHCHRKGVWGFELKTLGWCPKMWKVFSQSSRFSFWAQNVQQRVGHRFPSQYRFYISFFDVLGTLGFNFKVGLNNMFFQEPKDQAFNPIHG